MKKNLVFSVSLEDKSDPLSSWSSSKTTTMSSSLSTQNTDDDDNDDDINDDVATIQDSIQAKKKES